jgi:hypothetical protein
MAATVSQSARDWPEDKFSLFFYGTLLHPAVLKRVIGHEGTGLTHQSALLYVRILYTRYEPLTHEPPMHVGLHQTSRQGRHIS